MKTTLGQSHDVWPLVVPRLAPFWPYCLATLALAIKCMAHATWRKAHATLFFFLPSLANFASIDVEFDSAACECVCVALISMGEWGK